MTHDTLTPRLIRATLTLRPVCPAVDTTRVVPWEIWQAGIVFAGPTRPVAWDAIPSPWPTGRFRAGASLVAGRPARRAPSFPSAMLFAHLPKRKVGLTVRVWLSDWGEVAGISAMVRDHLGAGGLPTGERVQARIGQGTKC